MFQAIPSVQMLTGSIMDNNALGFVPVAVNKNSAAEDPVEGASSKRKRRLSLKGLQLVQSEGKKPATKRKPNDKSTKSSTKEMESGNNGNNSSSDDDSTEVNIDI